MRNDELIGKVVGDGYVKIAQFSSSSDMELGEYMDALRVSPNYVDVAVVFDNDTGDAILYAKRLNDGVSKLTYRSAIIERLDKQTDKGLAKYGRLLHANRLNAIARLEYLAEELTDGLQYIEHAKAGLHDVFDIQAGIVSRMMALSAQLGELERDELVDIARDANKLLGMVMGYDDEQGRKEGSR